MTTDKFRLSKIIHEYKVRKRALLDSDPGFREWLACKYKPIAGGWQY